MPTFTLSFKPLLAIFKSSKGASMSSPENPSSHGRPSLLPTAPYINYELEKTKDKKRKIGTGGIGDIKIRQKKGDPSFVVAVKTMRYSDDEAHNKEMDRALEKEITPLLYCKHPNILEYMGLTRGKSKLELGIVCRYATNHSLTTYLKNNPTANRMKILRDVAAGLEYLHAPNPEIVIDGKKMRIVHGDVHPGNVLIMGDGKAVLSDFGLCKFAEQAAQTSLTVRRGEAAGVAVYIAPEVHRLENLNLASSGLNSDRVVTQDDDYKGRRTDKADVFAFGMLIFATFANKDPEASVGSAPLMTMIAILQGERPKRRDISDPNFTNALWELASECWKGDAKQRPNMTIVRSRL